MIVKLFGMVTGSDTYEGKNGTVHQTTVDCGGVAYNCRGTVEPGLRRKDDVVIIGNLKIHSKGSFLQDEIVRRATVEDLEEVSHLMGDYDA